MGTSTWEPLLGNLTLGTSIWEPYLGNLTLGTSTWEPLFGNLYLGTSIREPGGMGFCAAPLCSETFTMAEDPSSFRCWGKMLGKFHKAFQCSKRKQAVTKRASEKCR